MASFRVADFRVASLGLGTLTAPYFCSEPTSYDASDFGTDAITDAKVSSLGGSVISSISIDADLVTFGAGGCRVLSCHSPKAASPRT